MEPTGMAGRWVVHMRTTNPAGRNPEMPVTQIQCGSAG
jgi:hypothetical protein